MEESNNSNPMFLTNLDEVRFLGLNTFTKIISRKNAKGTILLTRNKIDSKRKALTLMEVREELSKQEKSEVMNIMELIKNLNVNPDDSKLDSKVRGLIKRKGSILKCNTVQNYRSNKKEYRYFRVKYEDDFDLKIEDAIIYSRHNASTISRLEGLYDEVLNGDEKIKVLQNQKIPDAKAPYRDDNGHIYF